METSNQEVLSWGDEYFKKMATKIKEVYAEKTEIAPDDDFWKMMEQLFLFYRQTNMFYETIDLICEFIDTVTRTQLLLKFLNKEDYELACWYLKSIARILLFNGNTLSSMVIMDNVVDIYLHFGDAVRALQIALFLQNKTLVRLVFQKCWNDVQLKKQLCFMIARQGVNMKLDEERGMQEIANNLMLSRGYLALARDYEVMEPMCAKDVFKGGRGGGAAAGTSDEVDSARHILAETFVNAFLNAGFGNDSLMMGTDEWVLKNKEHERISATASLGLVCLWDLESGYVRLDKFFESNDSNVVAGALLGVGILNSGIKEDSDPVMALLMDYVDNEDPSIRIGAIMGLGVAYANTQNKHIGSKLKFILNHETSVNVDVAIFSAIALGLVYVSSCDVSTGREILKAILTVPLKLKKEFHHLSCLLHLSYGLLYLGKPESIDLEKIVNLSVLSCVYAGTRNDKVQEALYNNCDQEVAILGIALVGMGDEIILDTTIENLISLLVNGEMKIRKTVPLALSLLCISNPIRVDVIDTLHAMSHDPSLQVVMSAIISLGLVGSGTNNAGIARILRDLANVYCSNDKVLFCVRLSQGLLHLGKGLLTLDPYHSEGVLVSPVAICGLVTFLYTCLDMNEMILGKYHFVLYYLVLAMHPKMLITVDEYLKPLPVRVQLCRDVDTVSNASRIFETPVVLSPGEKARLCTDKYVPRSQILEGFVILRNNPKYKEATSTADFSDSELKDIDSDIL